MDLIMDISIYVLGVETTSKNLLIYGTMYMVDIIYPLLASI